MSAVRDAFAARFGADQADAIEAAADAHLNGVHDDPGSDRFKWALCITIGHECVTRFRADHGITVDPDELQPWVRDHGDLRSHDGDVDYLAVLTGAYQDWMPAEVSP